jgi:cytidylate kinase
VNTTKSEREFLIERMERFLRRRSTAEANLPEPVAPADRSRPSLTISRQCGAGLSRLESPLLAYLDELDDDGQGTWTLFDQSILGKIIEGHRMPGSSVPFVSENAKFPVCGQLRDRLAAPREEWSLFNHFANAIRQVCSAGRALVIGRAANQITSDLDNTFHVRLIAGKGTRIGFIARRDQTDHRSATDWVEATDDARAGFVKRNTGADIDDAVAYHLVLNTDHFADEVAVRIIADSMHEWSLIRSSEPSPGFSLNRPPSIIEGIFSSATGR